MTDYTNGSAPAVDPVEEHIAAIVDTPPAPAPEAPKVLTLVDIEQQIAQTEVVVNQLLGQVTATETYQAYLRMAGALEHLRAMRQLLSGA